MKQANNNEVDLLLRSLASGRDERSLQSGSLSGDGKRAFSDHLDADELNSYAEGVVPAPARARYTEHLADCEQCRRLVIGLTQAAGAAPRYESLEQQRGSSFWQKLAALFSPAVLRYAVPALALAGVIGISLLALRQGRPEFTAQNQPAADTSTSSERLKQIESPASNPTTGTRPEVQKTLESGTAADPNKPKSNLQDEKTGTAQAPGSDSNFATAPLVKDATQSGRESGEVQLQPSYAPETKAPAPPPANVLSEADKSAGIAKEQPAKREDRDEERRRDIYMNTPSDEHGPNRSAAPRSAAPQGGRQVDGLVTTRGASAPSKKEKAGEAEATTTVAGRHFKHEGNTWVDTAYESSRATINVARGSEQYRALVADEPGLRTIADQLRGVVIVVWKNRAYRIQ